MDSNHGVEPSVGGGRGKCQKCLKFMTIREYAEISGYVKAEILERVVL
jgi:hypothetical protein